MGFLQSQMWPELTRRFVLIVRASRQRPGSSTALAWPVPHGLSSAPRGQEERERVRVRQTRFPFIYFHRHFTDCHTIAPPSHRRSFHGSFLHSNSRLYFNHQECGPPRLSSVRPGQVLGNPSGGILSRSTHPYRANSPRDKKEVAVSALLSVPRYSIRRFPRPRENMKVPPETFTFVSAGIPPASSFVDGGSLECTTTVAGQLFREPL